MSCDIYSKLRIKEDYVLGHLSDAEKETYEKHFLECDTCYQELKLQETMVSLIKKEGEVLFADYLENKQERVQKRISKSFKVFSFPRFEYKFRTVIAAVVVLIIIMGSFYTINNFYQKDILSTIVYDEQVPYEFIPEPGYNPRGGENQTAADAFDLFYQKFLEAVSYYNELNYIHAIQRLEPLSSDVEKIQTVLDDDESYSAIKNYYFYFGLSYLAMATSKKTVIAESVKKHYLENAIQNLINSKNIGLVNKPHLNDKLSYFLGLTYSLAGFNQKAILELQDIEKTSVFYKKADGLLLELIK